jgi:hypothetical protein
LLQYRGKHSKEDIVGALGRMLAVVYIAAAVAGCSTPQTTREKGAIAGGVAGAVSGPLISDAIQSADQPPAPPPVAPLRVVVASPPPVAARLPQYVWVPAWGVYVLEGHDIAYHEGYHYYYYETHWYMARSYTGPWAIVVAPPPALSTVPPGHFHKRLPAGLAKQEKIPPGHRRID